MASASLATARISSALALFDMRKVGLSRASAAFAGSRVGNTLSVTAITGPAIANSEFDMIGTRAKTYASGTGPSTAGERAGFQWLTGSINQKLTIAARGGIPVSYTHLRATRRTPISYAVFCLKKKKKKTNN